MTRPESLEFDAAKIPQELRNIPRWVMWRYVEQKKVNGSSTWAKLPFSTMGTRASTTKPSTWTTFDAAVDAYLGGNYSGIGLVLGNDVQGIDLDDHRDPATGELSELAMEILLRVSGYAEVSPSGTGIKIFTRGNLDRSRTDHEKGVELYCESRYFTVTGSVIEGHENLPSQVQDLSWLVSKVFDEKLRLTATTQQDAVDRALAFHKEPIDGWDLDRVMNELLPHLDPDSGYNAWLQVGQAMHHQGQGDHAWLEAWDEWSANSNKYRTSECDFKWTSFSKQRYNGGVITLATLLKRIKSQPGSASLAKPSGRFRLLSSEELAQQKPLNWIVKHVLPKTGLAIIYGQSGTGKSFLTLDLAFAVSGGAAEWFDQKINSCAVTYCALEGQAGMTKRVEAWEAHHKRRAPTGLRFIIQPFDLLEDDVVPSLAHAIAEVGTSGIIILDTLARAAPSIDENSSKEMGTVIQRAATLQEITGGLVLLVAHAGKDQKRGLRGHSSLFAAADVVIKVNRNGSQRGWELEKSKDDTDGYQYGFTLDKVMLGVDNDLETIQSCVVIRSSNLPTKVKRLSRTALMALKTLQEAVSECQFLGSDEIDGVHIDDWRKLYDQSCTADNAAAKQKSFYRARKALCESGIVRVVNDVYYIVDPSFS
jgi:hypothetical protein